MDGGRVEPSEHSGDVRRLLSVVDAYQFSIDFMIELASLYTADPFNSMIRDAWTSERERISELRSLISQVEAGNSELALGLHRSGLLGSTLRLKMAYLAEPLRATLRDDEVALGTLGQLIGINPVPVDGPWSHAARAEVDQARKSLTARGSRGWGLLARPMGWFLERLDTVLESLLSALGMGEALSEIKDVVGGILKTRRARRNHPRAQRHTALTAEEVALLRAHLRDLESQRGSDARLR